MIAGKPVKRWRKLGLIFAPDGSVPWMRTHAANPVAEHLAGDRFRIYFSSRDARNQSSVAFVDINLSDPTTLLRQADAPVLAPGAPSAFDDAGISIGCVLAVGSRRYLYYMGWHLMTAVPWQNTIGLAISEGPDEPFRRVSPRPILSISDADPHTVSYPWVRFESGRFRMWYGSSTEWGPQTSDMRHVIKYAESPDGIEWSASGHIAIDADEPGEYALSRPCVLRDADRYRMWFCGRGSSYRIKYAESDDGLVWTRTSDCAGLDVSPTGWDSEMIEYPCVFDHDGRRYALYTGNGYGRTGFGLAVLDESDATS
jgi:hypothetical protein